LKIKIRESVEQPNTVGYRISRVDLRTDSIKSVKDEVVVESRIELYINDEHYAVFSVSPSAIKELVVGHLLAEGIIDRLVEIESLEIAKERVKVYLNKKIKLGLSKKPRLILTECGGTGNIPPRLLVKVMGVKDSSAVRFNSQIVFRAVETLNTMACMFRRTGGTHASALLNANGKVLAFSEDIGRHNAIDKVIGEAALVGVDFKKTLLASTGRLTSDMVVKAAQAGVPIIVSISAPTDKGIKIAEMTGLTLIGFARGKRFNIYTQSGETLGTSYLQS